jgi:hypothetical protein
MHSRYRTSMNTHPSLELPEKLPPTMSTWCPGLTRIAAGGAQRNPRSRAETDKRRHNRVHRVIVMSLRGMGRTIYIPEVALRSTSGFYEFAFVKLLASVFSSVSRMRLSAEGSRI